MSKFNRSLMALALAIVFLAASAQLVSAQSGQFPVGSYESGPFTISFKDGGSYEVTHSAGGGVKGTYKISGENIEITDVDGEFACPDGVGKYTWKVESEKLVMTVVHDPCEERAQALSMPLAKKK